MVTFIAFLLTILGCVNWLLIGMLQYDFIAGLFGFQASIFSRIIYILFGVAAAYLVLRVIVNRGSFKVWERKKKAARAEETAQTQQQPAQMKPAYANVEASQEAIPQNSADNQINDENYQINEQNSQNLQQKPPKKKKWWQFWRGGASNSKKKQKKSLNVPQERPQENSTPPIDIDISMSTPKNFNQPPTQNQPTQDNLFDEHFEK